MRRLSAIRVCGIVIPVNEGSSEDCPALAESWSTFDFETNAIWIDAGTPKNHRPLWLTHEALHALFDVSGAIRALATIFGVPQEGDKIGEAEEALVRVLAPHIHETFGPPRKVTA